jgi:Putative DNA-binding domain
MTQTAFATALMDPALPVPDGLIDPQGRPVTKRFNVYRNNVASSLTKVLEAGFPVIRRLVGEEFFAAMAGVYLRAHPPASRLMMLYGTDMPTFLASFAPVKHLPYLPDIARLELAIRQSYHAADAAPIAPEILAQITPDAFLASRLTFAPALRVIQSDWPIHAIWLANTNPTAPKPTMRPESIAVFRPDFDPIVTPLPAHAAGFLAALMNGQTVEAAMDANPVDLGLLLPMILQNNALTGLA